MNQQEFDIKTEEKTPTNVSDFRFAPIKGHLRTRICANGANLREAI